MKPNILFITIDSFRADKCYGEGKTSKTPNIDSLIENGIYFSQAICAADQTGASLASLFKAQLPINTDYNQITVTSNTSTYFDLLKKNNQKTIDWNLCSDALTLF